MKRGRIPGLYDGEVARAERTGRHWRAQVRLRDCGALIDQRTGLYEHHPDGPWTDIGTYRTLRVIEKVAEMLRNGTHVWQGEHTNSSGVVPGRLVPGAEANAQLLDLTNPAGSA